MEKRYKLLENCPILSPLVDLQNSSTAEHLGGSMNFSRWIFFAGLSFSCMACGIKAGIENGIGPVGRGTSCPVRNIQGSVLIQNLVRVPDRDGSWDTQNGVVKVTMLFSTQNPLDGTLTIVQQMNVTCAAREGLTNNHVVSALASVPQGGRNCQLPAISLNDPTCAN